MAGTRRRSVSPDHRKSQSCFPLRPRSRFRPISVFREADEDESGFMCCAFSARERFLMLGTCTGQLKLYNVFTGQEEASYNCHTSAITHLEPSRVSGRSHAPLQI